MSLKALIGVIALLATGVDLAGRTATESVEANGRSRPAYDPDLAIRLVSLSPSLQIALAMAGAGAVAMLLGR